MDLIAGLLDKDKHCGLKKQFNSFESALCRYLDLIFILTIIRDSF
jgi:hypothetical protein